MKPGENEEAPALVCSNAAVLADFSYWQFFS